MLRPAGGLGALTLVWMLTAAPAAASADPTLTVLGLTALDGAVDPADRMTTAVRRAAGEVEGVSYVPKDVALDQIVLAFDCAEPPDAPCLRQVGTEMGTDAMIYGYVRERGDGSGRLDVTLVLFDVRAGEEGKRVEDHAVQAAGGALDAAARGLVARLLGQAPEPAAEPNAAAGAAGGPGAPEPKGGGGGSGPSWVAWTLFGVGVALAGVGAYFTLATASRNGDDGAWHDLRADHPGASDVCSEPNLTRREESLCDRYTLQSTLQFAFYGAGAAAGAIGLYLILNDSGEETDDPDAGAAEATATATAFRATPVWLPGGGAVLLEGTLP